MADEEESLESLSGRIASLEASLSNLFAPKDEGASPLTPEDNPVNLDTKWLREDVDENDDLAKLLRLRVDELERRMRSLDDEQQAKPEPVGMCIHVRLVNVSGATGTSSAPPTYRYDGYDVNGVKVFSGAGPAWRRDNGDFNAARAGIAYRTPTGTYVLDIAFENEATDICA